MTRVRLPRKLHHRDGVTPEPNHTPVRVRLSPADANVCTTVYILDKFGVTAWGMKTYSYAYFENSYAISELAFESIKTPAHAPHDKPGPGNDTAGIDDTGLNPFSASYGDWGKADVSDAASR